MAAMKIRLCFSVGAIFALFCSGCVPTHIVSSPGATGIVLDRQTRAPVPGAEVAISRVWERPWPNYGVPTVEEAEGDIRPPRVTTGPDGRFAIPHERKWIMEYPVPEGYGRGTLVISHQGYKTVTVPLQEETREDVGAVLLPPGGR